MRKMFIMLAGALCLAGLFLPVSVSARAHHEAPEAQVTEAQGASQAEQAAQQDVQVMTQQDAAAQAAAPQAAAEAQPAAEAAPGTAAESAATQQTAAEGSVPAAIAGEAPQTAAPQTAAEQSSAGATAAEPAASLPAAEVSFHASRVRLVWPVTARAVRYELVLLGGPEDTPENVIARQDYIYTNGVEIDLTPYGDAAAQLFWKVYPLDHDGHAIDESTAPQSITTGTPDPSAPLPTTEFEQMDYAPLYPVFSWVPMLGAKHYAVEIYRERDGEKRLIRTLKGGEYDVYEEGGYTVPGRYDWRVCAVDEAGAPISDWSPFSSFEVTAPTPVAALGDSITHGGGAMTVPPGYLIYDWETYSPVPIKNLGYSGNTTAAMLERFERDVLPFSPRVLVIMGGVNDYRGTTYGSETVANLEAIRAKCDAYGIIPVFTTVTSINPGLILRYGQIEVPPADWKVHRDYINRWVMEQPYAVDVASALQDTNGWLDARYTTDGLHPDDYGKREIGVRIGSYLAEHFPWITDSLVKKPLPPALQQDR